MKNIRKKINKTIHASHTSSCNPQMAGRMKLSQKSVDFTSNLFRMKKKNNMNANAKSIKMDSVLLLL